MLSLLDSPRWTTCSAAGAPAEYLLPPDPPSELALEGRAARWAADCLLYGDALSAEDLAGRTTPAGYLVTAELAEFAGRYAEILRPLRPRAEWRADLAMFGDAPDPRVGGPHDCDVMIDSEVIRVSMLATGWKLIDVTAEPRLLLPAIAAMQLEQHAGAELWVFQPRPRHVDGYWRCARYDRSQMTVLAAWVGQRVLACEDGAAPAKVSNHCTGCRRRSRCLALEADAYQQFEVLEQRGAGHEMTGAQLGVELTFLDAARARIEARWSGVRAEADARARDGQFIPGWAMRDPPGRREFAVEPEVVSFVTGVAATKQVPCSPSEMESAGVPKSVVKAMVRRKTGRAVLAPVDPAEIERSFKNAKS